MGKVKPPVYEAPIARDLSGFSVQGQVTPDSMCTNGTSVVSAGCILGPTPSDAGSCAPTGMWAGRGGCTEGLTPNISYPSCRGGMQAREGCSTGTYYK